MSETTHTRDEASRLAVILRSRGKQCSEHDLNRAAAHLEHAVYPESDPITARMRDLSERSVDELTLGEMREMQIAFAELVGFVDTWRDRSRAHSVNAIHRIRKNILNLTQAEMADVCEVSQGTISKWERGQHLPDLPAMQKIRNEALRRGIEWDDAYFFEDHCRSTEA